MLAMRLQSWLIAGALFAGLLGAAPAFAQSASQACQAVVTVSPSTATETKVVSAVSGTNIFICGVEASSNGTNNWYLEGAVNTGCTGVLTQIGTEWFTNQFWAKIASPYIPGLTTGAGKTLCVHTTGSTALSLTVWYAQHP
jgi:hypothetical protein